MATISPMIKREPLQTEAYFDQSIAFKKTAIAEDESALKNPEQFAKPEIIAVSIFLYRRNLLMGEYSRGYPLNELREEFPLIVTAWEALRNIDKEGSFAGLFKNSLDNYTRALWLLSLAYLLGVEQPVLLRLLACIRNEGQDLLFERFVTAVAPELVRKPAKKLLYPKAYQPLYDAIDAPADEQAALMQQFLKKWYQKMSNAGWHDNHKGQDGGGFFGYWCWEAAGVAHAFGMDDSSFREMPYYPKDLADYARARRS